MRKDVRHRSEGRASHLKRGYPKVKSFYYLFCWAGSVVVALVWWLVVVMGLRNDSRHLLLLTHSFKAPNPAINKSAPRSVKFAVCIHTVRLIYA